MVAMLVDRARGDGLKPTGEGGLLKQMTKRILESALKGGITDHVGYDKHDPAGQGSGNSRNGHRAKTVITDVARPETMKRVCPRAPRWRALPDVGPWRHEAGLLGSARDPYDYADFTTRSSTSMPPGSSPVPG
uniref:transposase n=1 Tax=Couchioplanes caeruleus TaxID=56438 RepID=UPI000ABFF94B